MSGGGGWEDLAHLKRKAAKGGRQASWEVDIVIQRYFPNPSMKNTTFLINFVMVTRKLKKRVIKYFHQ